MARKYVVKQPKNQRPMINNAHTASIKRKMGFAIIPFVIGALALVGAMSTSVDDKTMKLVMLIVGLVLFVVGLLVFVKCAKDLNDYAKEYWEKEDAKNPNKVKQEEKPREKITWAQAVDEYKQESKATAAEASRMMAEKLAKAEEQRMAQEAKKAAKEKE